MEETIYNRWIEKLPPKIEEVDTIIIAVRPWTDVDVYLYVEEAQEDGTFKYELRTTDGDWWGTYEALLREKYEKYFLIKNN
jgi:hypothetical protein